MNEDTFDKLILFDLGNTLIYRDQPHIVRDADLISRFVKIDPGRVTQVLQEVSDKEFQGIYKPWMDGNANRQWADELGYLRVFFSQVIKELNSSCCVEGILNKRISERRYKLFPHTKKYLARLSKKYIIGILTNGRPSRRKIIAQLGISKYFAPDYIYISDELGLSKPNHDLYQYVLAKTPAYSHCLVDDELTHLQSADKFGWRTVKMDHKKDGYEALDFLL